MAGTIPRHDTVRANQTAFERLPRGAASNSRLRTLIRLHPMIAYFAVTFTISWIGVLLVVALGPGRFPVTVQQFAPYIPFWGLAIVAGPALAGPLVTGLVDGKAGLRDLLSRLRKWRLDWRWYAIALLTAPLALTLLLVPLSLASADFRPAIITTDAKVGLLVAGIGAGLMAGVFEELGWTGFAVPRLRTRHGVLASALILGVLWGIWHIWPFAAENGTPAGNLDFAIFLPNIAFFMAVLPIYRVLLVWVYDRTRSLLVTMVMHTSLSASAFFILAPQVSGVRLGAFYLTSAGLMWFVIAIAAIANRLRLASHGRVTRL